MRSSAVATDLENVANSEFSIQFMLACLSVNCRTAFQDFCCLVTRSRSSKRRHQDWLHLLFSELCDMSVSFTAKPRPDVHDLSVPFATLPRELKRQSQRWRDYSVEELISLAILIDVDRDLYISWSNFIEVVELIENSMRASSHCNPSVIFDEVYETLHEANRSFFEGSLKVAASLPESWYFQLSQDIMNACENQPRTPKFLQSFLSLVIQENRSYGQSERELFQQQQQRPESVHLNPTVVLDFVQNVVDCELLDRDTYAERRVNMEDADEELKNISMTSTQITPSRQHSHLPHVGTPLQLWNTPSNTPIHGHFNFAQADCRTPTYNSRSNSRSNSRTHSPSHIVSIRDLKGSLPELSDVSDDDEQDGKLANNKNDSEHVARGISAADPAGKVTQSIDDPVPLLDTSSPGCLSDTIEVLRNNTVMLANKLHQQETNEAEAMELWQTINRLQSTLEDTVEQVKNKGHGSVEALPTPAPLSPNAFRPIARHVPHVSGTSGSHSPPSVPTPSGTTHSSLSTRPLNAPIDLNQSVSSQHSGSRYGHMSIQEFHNRKLHQQQKGHSATVKPVRTGCDPNMHKVESSGAKMQSPTNVRSSPGSGPKTPGSGPKTPGERSVHPPKLSIFKSPGKRQTKTGGRSPVVPNAYDPVTCNWKSRIPLSNKYNDRFHSTHDCIIAEKTNMFLGNNM